MARAIATNPEIILFDEPTTGLDPITASTIDNLIVDTVRKMGVTTITVTHDLASVRRIADRVALYIKVKLNGSEQFRKWTKQTILLSNNS